MDRIGYWKDLGAVFWFMFIIYLIWVHDINLDKRKMIGLILFGLIVDAIFSLNPEWHNKKVSLLLKNKYLIID